MQTQEISDDSIKAVKTPLKPTERPPKTSFRTSSTPSSCSSTSRALTTPARRSATRVPFQNMSLNEELERNCCDTQKRLLSTPALRVARPLRPRGTPGTGSSEAKNGRNNGSLDVLCEKKKQERREKQNRISYVGRTLQKNQTPQRIKRSSVITGAGHSTGEKGTFHINPGKEKDKEEVKEGREKHVRARNCVNTQTKTQMKTYVSPTNLQKKSASKGEKEMDNKTNNMKEGFSTPVKSKKQSSNDTKLEDFLCNNKKTNIVNESTFKYKENYSLDESGMRVLGTPESYTNTCQVDDKTYIYQPMFLTAKLSNMRITTPSHCRDILVPITSDYTSSDSESDYEAMDKDTDKLFQTIPNSSLNSSAFIKSKPLGHVTAYLDIKAMDNNDASLSFKCILTELGATIKEKWNWTAPSTDMLIRMDNSNGFQSIGITHVVWRSGSTKILEKVKAANNYLEKINESRKIHCVGINWIMKCEEEDRHVDETNYLINLDLDTFSCNKRTPMEPRTLTPTLPNSIMLPSEKKPSVPKTAPPKPFTELERCSLIAAKKKIDFHKPIVSSPLARKCWTVSSE
ncbi:hypothetical protein T552_01028 [Pneumocystis carinii B80]|uniref:BRCT domain-containing protein n=1 Tax=Pneumocystis carinii (strain B80) TaxID=1408658 RepID=A0A0W4ZN82_PNEC8|nr:hypothetical protein T552_01028 [Pneumocystis carinii B80]KTW29823.1 hypothetical protein T552_01028 [Pneumocystis carinii B80]